MGSDYARRNVGSVEIDFQPFSIHSIAVAGGKVALVVGPIELDFLKCGVTLCISCSSHSEMVADGGKGSGKVFVFDVRGDNLSENTPPVANIDVPPEDAFFVFHYINAHVNESSSVMTVDACAYDSAKGFLGEYVLGNLKTLADVNTRNSMPCVFTHITSFDSAAASLPGQPNESYLLLVPLVDPGSTVTRFGALK